MCFLKYFFQATVWAWANETLTAFSLARGWITPAYFMPNALRLRCIICFQVSSLSLQNARTATEDLAVGLKLIPTMKLIRPLPSFKTLSAPPQRGQAGFSRAASGVLELGGATLALCLEFCRERQRCMKRVWCFGVFFVFFFKASQSVQVLVV